MKQVERKKNKTTTDSYQRYQFTVLGSLAMRGVKIIPWPYCWRKVRRKVIHAATRHVSPNFLDVVGGRRFPHPHGDPHAPSVQPLDQLCAHNPRICVQVDPVEVGFEGVPCHRVGLLRCANIRNHSTA